MMNSKDLLEYLIENECSIISFYGLIHFKILIQQNNTSALLCERAESGLGLNCPALTKIRSNSLEEKTPKSKVKLKLTE